MLGGSVEEICERAGFTRGAFYSNFEHKDDLIVAVLDREEDATVQRLAETIDLDPKTATLCLNMQNASLIRTTDLIKSGMAAVGRTLTVSAADAADVVLAIIERSNRRAFIEPGRHERRSLAEASITKALLGLSVPDGEADADDAYVDNDAAQRSE